MSIYTSIDLFFCHHFLFHLFAFLDLFYDFYDFYKSRNFDDENNIIFYNILYIRI